MNLFQYLAKIQRKTSFNKSEEAIFFNEHAYLFAKNDLWVNFPKASDPFDVVRGNIIIRSIINKETIEKAYLQKKQGLDAGQTDSLSIEEYMRDILSSLPYITYKNEKIYVPIFPEFLNIFYREEFEKLIQKPYKALLSDFQAAAIDSFDQYGIALFDSYFTKLVPIRRTNKIYACYDYDAEAIYFINDQGRLDARICLFDKKIKKISKSHMSKRILKVADAYLSDDREALINALKEENLISAQSLNEYLLKESKKKKK